MKISCTQENISQGLNAVSHVASKNTSLPILTNVLIKVFDGEIKLLATNLEIGVSCTVRGKIEEEGEFTVNSRLFADYINLLPKEKVDINVADDNLNLVCKNNATKIKGHDAADFPLIPQLDKTSVNKVVVDSAAFKQALSQVVFAVAISETRPEINGVLFNFKAGNLTMVATDSYRLAEKTIKLKGTVPADQKIIIPGRTLQELQRILGNFKDPAGVADVDEVNIYIADNQVLFTLGDIELISRLVEGQYPDYESIIPSEVKTKTVLNTQDLVKAAKTASLFARNGIFDILLDFAANGEVEISSTNSQLGENNSKLTGTTTGEANSIVVNFRYLLDGLQNLGADQVEVSVVNGDSPCVLRGVTKEENYLYIVMPIKQ